MPREKVISGNKAVAHGVRLAGAKVIPIYPITPQTSIAEYLADFATSGEMDAEIINIEGEHSAMSACYGAELVGVRSYTATCSHGLAYMHEPMAQLTAYRLPVVMTVTNRRLGSLHSSAPDYTDTMPERDSGWMQFYLESNQEALDMMIQTYKIAEDERVMLPAMNCIDGFYLSYSNEPVRIPDKKEVDEFLLPYTAEKIIMDPEERFETPLLTAPSDLIPTYERLYQDAMERAKEVIKEVDKDFGKKFGRSYGGLIEKYKMKNAKAALIVMGSMTTAGRRAVENMRKEDEKIGLVKIRSFRPFPTKEIKEIAEGVDAIGVIDRAVARGNEGGPLFTDVRSAIYDLNTKPAVLNFIAGLSGGDVRIEDFEHIGEKTLKAANGEKLGRKVVDYMEDTGLVEKYSPPPSPTIETPDTCFGSGLKSCSGCAMTLILRHTLDVLGRNTVMSIPSSCALAITTGEPYTTPLGVPLMPTNMPSPGGALSGIRRALWVKGRNETNVLGFGGDGATADIGFTSLSGAGERGESVIWLCYDNEAYMNTGVQMSGTTPYGAWTTTTPIGTEGEGKIAERKNVPLMMALHDGVSYVATASVAHIKDLKRKVKKSSEVTLKGEGMAYLHIQSPCPVGWRFPVDKTIEVARSAVKTGAWPVYEIENQNLEINLKPKSLEPIKDYLDLQGRFKHLGEEKIADLQEKVEKDWKRLLWIEKNSPPIGA